MKTYRAVLRYARTSPLKARQVLDQIRGKPAEEALKIAKFSRKRAGRMIYKLLMSAVSNASQDKEVDVDLLVVWRAYADRGPVMKRIQPRAMGRAYLIRRPTCHITVELRER